MPDVDYRPDTAEIISLQKKGKSWGTREVISIPSRTTGSSTQVAPAWSAGGKQAVPNPAARYSVLREYRVDITGRDGEGETIYYDLSIDNV